MPVPEGWQPQYSERQVRALLERYKGRANLLSQTQSESLQQHAEVYNIPYYPGDFSILDAIKQAGQGFWQGLTTLKPPGEGPDNEFEAIARNLGHLAGFAPGIIAAPLRAAGIAAKALNAGATSRMFIRAAHKAHAFREASIPMQAAKLATRQAKKLAAPAFKAASVAQAGAAQTAAKVISAGPIAHMAEGAFHLGVASAVSHWQEGIDAMMGAGISGAAFGGVFRGIGNLTPQIKKALSLMGTDSEAATKAIKALAGSMVMGLPETARGATTPEQVYGYLLGAYFGGKETPWTVQQSSKFIEKMEKRASEDSEFSVKFDPELMPEWAEISPEVQKIIPKEIERRKGTTTEQRAMGYALLEETGELDKIPPEKFVEDFKKTGKIVGGEEQMVMDEKPHPDYHHGISGGAKGADAEFAKIGKDFGHPFVHYVFKGALGSRAQSIPRGLAGQIRPLGERELSEANEAVNKAQEALGRDISKMGPYGLNLFRRTFHAMKYANGVYAIAPLNVTEAGIKSVKGGTGWGAQMAIQMRKPVYVFSPETLQWYQYNYKSGQFVPHEGVPKLTSRYAGIGMRDLPPAGKEAIRQLFAENVEKPVEKQRISAVEVPPISATEGIDVMRGSKWGNPFIVPEIYDKNPVYYKKQGFIRAESREDAIQSYEDWIRGTAHEGFLPEKRAGIVAGLDAGELTGKTLKYFKPDASDSHAVRLAKLVAEQGALAEGVLVKSPADKEIESEDTVAESKFKTGGQLDLFEDIEGDPGEGNVSLGLGHRMKFEIGKYSVQFVNKHMPQAWIDAEPEFRAGVKLDLANKLQDILVPYLKERPAGVEFKPGGSEAWAREVERETDYSLDIEAKRAMRKWMRRKDDGKPVKFFSALDKGSAGIDIGLMPEASTYTKAGNPKNIKEPIKLIEEAYIEAGGNLEDIPLITMDHVTVKTDNGNKDFDLSRYRTVYLRKQFGGSPFEKENKANNRWNNSLSRLFGFLDRDNDMYAFGGAGDKDKIFFIKYHPATDAKADIKLVKEALGLKFGKEYNAAESAFAQDYGMFTPKGGVMSRQEARALHEKAYASNIRYDLALNGLDFTKANIRKLIGDGFIHGATAYNKRLQIYMTDGYKHSNEYATENVPDLTEGKYKYQIMEEKYTKPEDVTVNTPHTKMEQSTDGAIIARDDVADAINADFGNIESGQNKSFIISKDSKHGALLGKYMFHKAGDKQSADMLKKNQHFKIYNSSAKQKGTRLYNTDYFMNPSDIRGGGSTAATKEMLDPQIWVKQLFTILGPTNFSPTSRDIINDIDNSILRGRFIGEDKWNKELAKYMANPSDTKRNALIKNLERIGVEELMNAITNMNGPDANRFSDLAYATIMRQSLELADHMVKDGEMSAAEAQVMRSELEEANSVVDRMLRRGRTVIKRAQDEGKDISGLGLYLHKFMRNWRMSTMRNWITKQITRPKMDNSIIGFMRPYDDYLARDADRVNPRLKELDTNSEIFFLDEEYRKVNLKTSIKGKQRITLGELWDLYIQPKGLSEANKKKAEELFEAVAVRVPLDSTSGAQVLKFQGFTGRKGHGVLLHGRAMGAMGGADLDGDEAFIYFGDEAHGMKKAWKDVFKANRDEYVDDKGKISSSKTAEIKVGFNKGKTMEEIFVDQPKNAELQKSKGWQWSPFQRVAISQRAVEGRNLLGTVVTNAQVLRAAHAALIETPRNWKGRLGIPKGSDRFEFDRGKESYRITYSAKTNPEWLELQRSMTRAQIAFASDPLDQLGLRSGDLFLKELWTAYFHLGKAELKKGNRWYPTDKIKNAFDLNFWELRGGIIEDFSNMNSAYFGRNWAAGKRWSYDEIKAKGSVIDTYNAEQLNTILPKMVQILQPVDWNDSIFSRINKESLLTMYDQANEYAASPEGEVLREMMRRPTLETPYNVHIQAVIDNNLSSHIAREEIAHDINRWKNVIGKLEGFKERIETDKTPEARYATLKYIVQRGEEFLTNDLTDIITIRRMMGAMDPMAEEEKVLMPKVHAETERVKTYSYLRSRNRRGRGTFARALTAEDKKKQEVFDGMIDEFKVVNADWYKQMRGLEKGDERSAEMDQAEVDDAIRKYKRTLTPNLQVAYDYLMLGSLNRGPQEAVEKVRAKLKAEGRVDALMNDILRSMYTEAAKTSVSTLGYISKAINPRSVEDFMLDFATLTQETWRPPTSEDIKSVQEGSKALGKIHEINAPGQQIEIPIEPEIDPKVEGSLIEDMAHFEGLQKGKLTKEQASIITELAGHLKHYNMKVSQNLDEITRGLPFINKDLNAMNVDDFRALNNLFADYRHGTIWQRIWKDKGPPSQSDLQKRYYWLFPETVDKELMRDEIQLLKRKGIYANRFGEVKYGDIVEPSHFLGAMMDWANRGNRFATLKSEEWINRNVTELLFLDGLKEGDALHEIAIRERELGEVQRILSDPLKEPMLARAEADTYQKAYKESVKNLGFKEMRDRKFTINIKDKRLTMTGREIVDKIKDTLTEYYRDIYVNISGKEGALEPYIIGYYDKINRKNPIIDVPRFIADMRRDYQEGKPITMDVGIDGLRRIYKSQMLELISTTKEGRKIRDEMADFEIKETGRIAFENYHPHMITNKKLAEKALLQANEKVMNSGLSKEEMEIQLRRLAYKYKQITGEWGSDSMLENMAWNETLDNIGKKQAKPSEILRWLKDNRQMGNMFARDSHIPGWLTDRTAHEMYARNLMNTYYRLFSQIMSRQIITSFETGAKKKGWDRIKDRGDEYSLMERWSNYYKLYVQDALNNPTIIPDRMLNDPKMKIAGTPYAWWADNRVRDKVNKIAEFLGLTNKNLPENLQGISLGQLRHWSNLEAKYEFATLLTHPKTIIANLFGGEVHNIQSAGFQNLRDARNPKWLKANLPEIELPNGEFIRWENMADVEKFINYHGVLPEFLRYEAELSAGVRTAKGKEFIGAATKLITERPEATIQELRELNRKYRVTESAFKKIADIFMGRPERILRRDSFMAHFVHYWKKFGGAIKDPNHPFLIELAQRGVKATQFLYNAPNRPAFVRSALGKVMGRFQLWSWNAAKFRFDLNRQMNIYGYRPGSEAYEKYKRQMSLDLFMLAMANIFMFSMFDNQLPAPWNWMQDTADWLLGDEKERDRAFFGAYPTTLAPLQAITPPIARLGPAALRGWLDDDYTKLAEYQIWTMFPMGRMFRSAFGPGNLIENPYRAIEQITGFPFLKLGKQITEEPTPEERAPGFRGFL